MAVLIPMSAKTNQFFQTSYEFYNYTVLFIFDVKILVLCEASFNNIERLQRVSFFLDTEIIEERNWFGAKKTFGIMTTACFFQLGTPPQQTTNIQTNYCDSSTTAASAD